MCDYGLILITEFFNPQNSFKSLLLSFNIAHILGYCSRSNCFTGDSLPRSHQYVQLNYVSILKFQQ